MVAPETINIRINVMIISTTNDCMDEPDGMVPKYASGVTFKINVNVPLPKRDPNSCDGI